MSVIAQVDLGNSVEEFTSTVARVLPQFLLFLLILVVGYFVAKAVARILDKVLERVGFDRAVERGGVGRALQRTKYDPSDILGKVVFYALFLFVLQLAFGVFGDNPISELITGVIAFLPNIFVAIIIIVVTAAIAAAVKEIVEASLGGLPYGRALAVGASTAILVVGFFAALDQLRIAEDIVQGLFYAILAVVVGVAIVAIGGAGITPMRQVWERTLTRVQQEAPQVRQQAEGASDRVAQRAQERTDQARSVSPDSSDVTAPRTTGGSTSY
jgi:MFS family permease